MSPIANSAVGTVNRSGTMVNHTPAFVAASNVDIVKALERRPMTRSLGQAARKAASILSFMNASSPTASRHPLSHFLIGPRFKRRIDHDGRVFFEEGPGLGENGVGHDNFGFFGHGVGLSGYFR